MNNYHQAEQDAMAQLVDELESSMGLYFAVFAFDAGDTVVNDLLPLHPALTPQLSEEQRNKKILEAVGKIFEGINRDIKNEYPESLDRLIKENLGE